MAWNVEFLRSAERQLSKIDRVWQSRLLDYLEDEIAPLEDPRNRGKTLTADYARLWRFRVGDYRIVCEISDDDRTITVVKIGHRKSIYR